MGKGILFKNIGIFDPDINEEHFDSIIYKILPKINNLDIEYEKIIEGSLGILISNKSIKIEYTPGKILVMLWGTIYNFTMPEIVESYKKNGIQFLHQLNGKFGMVIWDSRKRILYCAIDRFGIERLYYSLIGTTFLFSSHITPILKSGLVEASPNYEKLYNFINHSYTGGNATFFNNIQELPMGHFLSVDQSGWRLNQWYSLKEQNISASPQDLEEGTRLFMKSLFESVKDRIKDGNSVGLALSGGIDSSSIVQVASDIEKHKIPPRKLHIFSLRFHDHSVDEGPFIEEEIREVKNSMSEDGIIIHNVYPRASDLENLFTEILKYFEEPFHKIHTFMDWILCQKAMDVGVPYILFGQGAESIIGGQSENDYVAGTFELLRKMKLKDFWTEAVSSKKFRDISLSKLFIFTLNNFFPKSSEILRSSVKKIAGDNSFLSPDMDKHGYKRYKTPKIFRNMLKQSIFEDLYLQPYEIREFNKNRYSEAVDVRFPFLDHRLVEIAYSLPNELKIYRGISKIVLRRDPEFLPVRIRKRTDKMMSSKIMNEWFRGPLREFVQSIIRSNSFRRRGLFNLTKIEQAVQDHNERKINIGKEISRWISIELWFREFINKKN